MNTLNMELTYIFTIFFVTIGPIKVILPFQQVTSQLDSKHRRDIAFTGALCALIILIAVMIIAHTVIHSWKLSEMAIQITGGLILFITSFQIIGKTQSQMEKLSQVQKSQSNAPTLKITGLTPIAIPIIISPVGLLAAIAVMSIAKNEWGAIAKVATIMLSILFLDFLAMTFANAIMRKVKVIVLYAIGWIFAILQAVLGIQFIIDGVLKLIRQN